MGAAIALMLLAQVPAQTGHHTGRAIELSERLKKEKDGATRAELRALIAELAPLQEDVAQAIVKAASALGGVSLTESTRPDEVLEILLSVHDSALLVEDASQRARQALNLAGPLLALGERDRLEKILEDALLKSPTRLRPYLVANLVQLAAYRQDWNEALELLDNVESPDRASTDAGSGGSLQEIDIQLAGIRGDVYLQMGLLDRARHWILLERDLANALPKGSPQLEASIAVHLANLRLNFQDWETLVREVDSALGDTGATLRVSTRSQLLVRQGIALGVLEEEDPERERRAETVLRAVLDLEGVPEHEVHSARTRLVELLLGAGRLEEASALIETVEAAPERPASPLEQAFFSSLALRHARLAGASEIEISERLRQTADAYEALRREWLATEIRPGGIGFLETARVRAVLGELTESRLASPGNPTSREAAAETLLRAQEASTLARRLDAPSANLDRVRARLLGPDHGMLVYLPTRSMTHVFAIDRQQVVHDRAAGKYSLDRLRRKLLEIVIRSPAGLTGEERARRRNRLEAASRSLARELLPDPIARRVARWNTVTIVGGELLGYLPFEALLLEDGYLGLEWGVNGLPSASLGLALARRGTRLTLGKDLDSLCLASVSPREDLLAKHGLSALPFGEEEQALLLGAYPEGKVKALIGPDATFAALEAHLDRSVLLHILAHGVHDSSRERSAGLLFAPSQGDARNDSGLIFAEAIEELEEVPEVVLLTACEAGRGPDRTGDAAASHLGGALLSRGANAVLLPVLTIPYEATLELCSEVHARLREGLSIAESTRRARRRVASDERWQDPHYWALLHVQGLAAATPFPRAVPPKDPPAAPGWVGSIVIAAGALATGVWLGRTSRR